MAPRRGKRRVKHRYSHPEMRTWLRLHMDLDGFRGFDPSYDSYSLATIIGLNSGIIPITASVFALWRFISPTSICPPLVRYILVASAQMMNFAPGQQLGPDSPYPYFQWSSCSKDIYRHLILVNLYRATKLEVFKSRNVVPLQVLFGQNWLSVHGLW